MSKEGEYFIISILLALFALGFSYNVTKQSEKTNSNFRTMILTNDTIVIDSIQSKFNDLVIKLDSINISIDSILNMNSPSSTKPIGWSHKTSSFQNQPKSLAAHLAEEQE